MNIFSSPSAIAGSFQRRRLAWWRSPKSVNCSTEKEHVKIIEEFIHRESSAGMVLIFVTAVALLLKNSSGDCP